MNPAPFKLLLTHTATLCALLVACSPPPSSTPTTNDTEPEVRDVTDEPDLPSDTTSELGDEPDLPNDPHDPVEEPDVVEDEMEGPLPPPHHPWCEPGRGTFPRETLRRRATLPPPQTPGVRWTRSPQLCPLEDGFKPFLGKSEILGLLQWTEADGTLQEEVLVGIGVGTAEQLSPTLEAVARLRASDGELLGCVRMPWDPCNVMGHLVVSQDRAWMRVDGGLAQWAIFEFPSGRIVTEGVQPPGPTPRLSTLTPDGYLMLYDSTTPNAPLVALHADTGEPAWSVTPEDLGLRRGHIWRTHLVDDDTLLLEMTGVPATESYPTTSLPTHLVQIQRCGPVSLIGSLNTQGHFHFRAGPFYHTQPSTQVRDPSHFVIRDEQWNEVASFDAWAMSLTADEQGLSYTHRDLGTRDSLGVLEVHQMERSISRTQWSAMIGGSASHDDRPPLVLEDMSVVLASDWRTRSADPQVVQPRAVFSWMSPQMEAPLHSEAPWPAPSHFGTYISTGAVVTQEGLLIVVTSEGLVAYQLPYPLAPMIGMPTNWNRGYPQIVEVEP